MKRDRTVLVLGSGTEQTCRICLNETDDSSGTQTFAERFERVVTLDINPAMKPTVVWDLNNFPWPFEDNAFDEIHAYELLEHITKMGDVEGFFRLWREIYRVLKPGGMMCATTPWWHSVYAFCDPGHSFVYSRIMLAYLDQRCYAKQVGHGAMSDYRDPHWPAPYNLSLAWPSEEVEKEINPASFMFVLQKRPWVEGAPWMEEVSEGTH